MKPPLQIKELTRYRRYHRENNYIFGGHSHAHWEIDVILKGEFEVVYDDTVILLEESMLVLYEADVFHRSRVISTENTEDLVIHFTTDDIPKSKFSGVYELSETDISLLHVLMDEAEKETTQMDEFCLSADSFNYQAKKLLEILLMRIIEKQKTPAIEKHPEERIFRHAIAYMKKNIDKNLTIDAIAKSCHTSSTKLKTVFKKFTGTGVIAHFSSMKITVAKKLLKKGLTIFEISEKLGYSSQAYMSLCFKKETGMTPLQFKKNN